MQFIHQCMCQLVLMGRGHHIFNGKGGSCHVVWAVFHSHRLDHIHSMCEGVILHEPAQALTPLLDTGLTPVSFCAGLMGHWFQSN